MEFLFSNYPPVKTEYKTFSDMFYSLIPQSSKLNISVGYVSSDSLMELKRIIELNSNLHEINLIIGMHYFEYFTKIQYNAAMVLNDFLSENHLGEVKLVNAFKYHGKLYSYSNDSGPFAGIIGSDNLANIVKGGTRIYESSFLINQNPQASQMKEFIDTLSQKAARNIADLDIDTFNSENPVLAGHEGVDKLSPTELTNVLSNLSNITFEIPAKTEPHSNLNCYHGKGRVDKKTGLEKPRPWYEVELIAPISMRRNENYPKGTPAGEPDKEFRVFTDDGFTFLCKANGGEKNLWNKNLRSSKDLTTLGKWIKGRLENEGVLKIGDMITEDTLRAYGRNTITMTKIKDSENWYLNWGVKK